MILKIVVCFLASKETQELKLAELQFTRLSADIRDSLSVPESKISLPDGSTIAINARYSPTNAGTSIMVMRNGVQLALVLTPWERCDPYLGIRVENIGFLHLYCQRERDSAD